MPGLRRLSLNHNPDIGDRGVQLLVHEAKDDLWLRAVDLQNTGLTDEGAAHLVHLVRNNPNLSVVDARNNPGMSDDCLSEILAILAINNADKTETQYKWLSCQTAKNIGDCKKISSIPRLSSSISKIRKQTSSTSESKLQKEFNPPGKFQDDSLVKENQLLRRQIEELNHILDKEIKVKAEILQKNYYLMDALENCQLEKRELEEEFAKKKYVSEEAWTKMNEIFKRLTEEEGYSEDSEMMKTKLVPEIQKRTDNQHEIILEEDEISEKSASVRESVNATKRAEEIFQKFLKQKSK